MQPAASQGSVARALTTSRSGNFPLLHRRRTFAAILLLVSALLAVGGFWNWRMLKKVDAIPQAIEDAVSLAHLMQARSPGQRTASELVKTKQQRALSGQRLPDTTQIRVPEAALERPMDATGLVSVAPLLLADTGVEANVPAGGVDVTPDISASPGASGPGVTTAPGSGAPSPGSPPGTLPSPQPKLPPSPSAVPEPQSWATTLVGFGLMGWFVRRRGRNRRLGNSDGIVLTHAGAQSGGRATSPP